VKALFVWLLAVKAAFSAMDGPLDPQRFGMLNHDPSLSAQLAEDSIEKWLVRTSDPNDLHQSITLSFLGQQVSEAIRDGSVAVSITSDLSAGDDALYKAMARVLYSFNFSDEEAMNLLDNWARLGPDKTLNSVLANATEGGRSLQALTGLLQLAAFSFRTIKSWSRFAGDFRSPTSKCSAKITRKSVFVLLKHKIWGFTL